MEGWREFYLLYPFDDFHRYHRPAALVSASMGTGNLTTEIAVRLNWLSPEPVAFEFPDADLRTLAAFGLKPPRG